MSKEQLASVFWITAIILVPVSFWVTFAYAGPEPLFEYHRVDAFAFIGIATAVIAIWIIWSLSVMGLMIGGIFGRGWLAGLLAAAICVFYRTMVPDGYLYDLEHFMLSPKQQERIGVQVLKE